MFLLGLPRFKMFLLGLPQHANILHPSLSAMWFATPCAVSLSGATNKMENRKTISLLIADTKTPPSSSPPNHPQMRFHSPIWSFGQQVETRYQLVIKRYPDTQPQGPPTEWDRITLLMTNTTTTTPTTSPTWWDGIRAHHHKHRRLLWRSLDNTC